MRRVFFSMRKYLLFVFFFVMRYACINCLQFYLISNKISIFSTLFLKAKTKIGVFDKSPAEFCADCPSRLLQERKNCGILVSTKQERGADMIYTVTLNPSLDYWMSVDHLQEGQVHRATASGCSFGGKGLNVSATLCKLGMPSVAVGFAAGWTGDALIRYAEAAGLVTEFVWAQNPDALTRINVKLRGGETTEINGSGCPVTVADLQALTEKLESVTEGDTVVLAGSLPPGAPTDFYAALVTALRARGVQTVVDCEGEALENAVKANPFLVKPNRHELEKWAKKPLPTMENVLDAAVQMQQAGAQRVLVSLGGDGALFLDADGGCYRAAALRGTVLQTVGAGDAMLAGFLYGYAASEQNAVDALRWGTCAAGAVVFGEDPIRLYAEAALAIEPIAR
jgi:1-phosphofructokinase